MEARRLLCYSMSVVDRPGHLASLVRQFANQDVSLAGLWTFSIGEGKAWVIIVPEDPALFKKVTSALSIDSAEGTCFHVTGDNRIGALSQLLETIAQKGLNVHALDSIAVDNKFGCYIWPENNEIEQVAEVLGL